MAALQSHAGKLRYSRPNESVELSVSNGRLHVGSTDGDLFGLLLNVPRERLRQRAHEWHSGIGNCRGGGHKIAPLLLCNANLAFGVYIADMAALPARFRVDDAVDQGRFARC